jgi:hypothetical protein
MKNASGYNIFHGPTRDWLLSLSPTSRMKAMENARKSSSPKGKRSPGRAYGLPKDFYERSSTENE